MIRKYRNLVVNQYKPFTKISNKLTEAYEGGFGIPCDLYFPIHDANRGMNYQKVNLYEPAELPNYPEEPSVRDVYFYIPNLMRKESMNSVADQFDNFALQAEGKSNRPFIETTSAKELPIATKVVVKLGESKMFFFVDQKTVVNGVNGHMLMRQYLSPLTLDGKRVPKDGGI